MKIDTYLSPCTKLKSKCIKDLNIKPTTLNLIEEKVGNTLERIGTGDHFLHMAPGVLKDPARSTCSKVASSMYVAVAWALVCRCELCHLV